MRRQRREIPRIVFVVLLGVLAGLMLVLLHRQFAIAQQQGIQARPLYKSWQAWVFFTAVVFLYFSYLKQHIRLASQHVVDEKIRTHRLIECLPQGILVTDEDQQVLAANAAAGKLLGRDPTACLEAPLASLARPSDGAAVLPVGQSRVGLNGNPGLAVVHPVSPEKGQSGGAVVVLMIDDKARLAPVVRLGGLREALAKLSGSPGDESALTDLLLAADRAADRAQKPPEGEAVPCPLGAALDQSLSEMEAAIKLKRLTVARDGAWDLAAKADPARLRAALKELLRNALAAAPAGSALSLSVARSGPEIRLKIENAGAAIRGDQAAGQEDHGLALARAALTGMGGTLRLEGMPGRGTRATLDLPAA